MKAKLMILSLSPLALLTIIRNYSFVTTNAKGVALSAPEFLYANKILLLIMLCCLLWILVSVEVFIEFNAFKWSDKKSGYEVKILEDNEAASLNFFLTLIIPLLIDDVGSIQGAITFVVLVFLICMLLYRTSLFYANPILALFGYRVYTFRFLDNPDVSDNYLIGLSKGTIGGNSIEYKKITDKVIYIREMKR